MSINDRGKWDPCASYLWRHRQRAISYGVPMEQVRYSTNVTWRRVCQLCRHCGTVRNSCHPAQIPEARGKVIATEQKKKCRSGIMLSTSNDQILMKDSKWRERGTEETSCQENVPSSSHEAPVVLPPWGHGLPPALRFPHPLPAISLFLSFPSSCAEDWVGVRGSWWP